MHADEPESSDARGRAGHPVYRNGRSGGLDPARITVNLSPRAAAAVNSLMRGWGVNKTDAISRAVRLADLLQGYTVNDRLVVKSDGHDVEVHLL